MLDAGSVRILIGFDFHDVDVLRLDGSQNLRALLLAETFIMSVYVFDVVCHIFDA